MNTENKLIKNKKDQARMDAIVKGLNVAPITAQSVSQPEVIQSYPSDEQYIVVTLDKLRPYEHNPRKTRNPNFDIIKESIRRRGLDHKPNITRRPGEEFYIIADGGNTRLQALKELFTETQDTRFWSISCHYKPWKGDTANNVEAELDLLIGHLIENDTRADLSFIEKALGILQAKEYYEKKLDRTLSSRELSAELEKDGYIIHQSNITKMERCVEYLYPSIPDVLLKGLGHTQIDKLLSIRNNAVEVWHQYRFENDDIFTRIWGDSLARCNDEPSFHIKSFQDYLITAMLDELGEDTTSYEALHLEIDLDEQKFRRLAAKQQELDQKIADSAVADKSSADQPAQPVEKTKKPVIPTTENKSAPEPAETSATEEETADFIPAFAMDDADLPFSNTDGNAAETLSHTPDETDFNTALSEHFINDFGLVPGMTVRAQREQKAQENGLSFAMTGRQPVADIWQVYPARKHKAEAYSLALDIAETVNLDELVEHVVKDPVDYSYRMKPLQQPSDETTQTLYNLLAMLQTDDFTEKHCCEINPDLLLGTESNPPVIEDITLVKIFRLIRLVRYIRASN